MKRALYILAAIACLFFTTACFAATDEEFINSIRNKATQGDAAAQGSLGYLYETGDGVKQNYVMAKEWYKQACTNGLQLGCDKYDEIVKMGYWKLRVRVKGKERYKETSGMAWYKIS